jgi:hypothetical protein
MILARTACRPHHRQFTGNLSRVHNSSVIARNTAFTFNDKNVDAKEVGKQFGIRYVLEGSLQRDQDRTRVNGQLIDTQSGVHLWADRFEDTLRISLCGNLRRQLVIAEAEKGAQAKNPDAIDLTMRGRVLMQGPRRRTGAQG